ncbi:MAG: pentapeptide repeat-containing protein [Cyanobacteria bacterium J06597_16]
MVGVANFSGADLTGANLRGVNRSRAIFCHTIMPDGDEENRDCE